MRNPEVLPSGRNLHGFDPFRIPSAFAVKDGAKQAQKILQKTLTGRTDPLRLGYINAN